MFRFPLLVSLLTLILFPVSLVGGLPSRFHNFAQVADGGRIRTTFLLLNQNPQAVNATIRFFGDRGTPLPLTIEGTTGSTFTVSIPAGGMRKLTTAGTASSIQVGWAQIRASEEIGAQVLFETFSGNQLITQAAVESNGPVILFDLFIEQQQDTNTGIALANLSERGPILVRMTLKDENGNVRAVRDITLVALGHTARFVSELFPEAAGLRGTLRVQTSGPVSVVTLQQTGLVLSTLPVIDVFF